MRFLRCVGHQFAFVISPLSANSRKGCALVVVSSSCLVMFSSATYPICDMLLEEDLRDIETVYKCIYIYIFTYVCIYIYICEGVHGHLCNFRDKVYL